MKKVILSLTFLLTLAAVSNAQGFRLGAKAGANLNKLSGVPFKEEFDLGYHLGGFAEIDFSEKLGIQPEVLFNQINARRSSGFNSIYTNLSNPNAAADIKLNYLSIPILLRYNVGKLLTLNAGPQFGILIDKHETLLENGQEAFKNGDFGMVGGATINLKSLRVYGRYNIGLANINDIDDRDQWKNQQLQLGIGLKL
jgi:hypothetical protein